MRVYIWMEGTDADCINNEAAEDPATCNVNVKLAGVSAELDSKYKLKVMAQAMAFLLP